MSRIFPRILSLACLAGLTIAGSGCVIFDKFTTVMPVDNYEPVGLIEMPFHPFIYHIDDTIHPGKLVPCLKGKVYLMHKMEVQGEELAKPVVARGKLVTQVFDTTSQEQGVAPRMITEWKLEQKALKLIQSSDQIGIGYTLFLPFEDYTPAIKKVMLRVIYEDEKGHSCQGETKNIALRMAEDSPQLNMTKSLNVPATLLPRR